MDLRGLTIGEIFDRSVTIYVRHLVVFTLIVLTLLAPLAVLRFLTIEPSQADFSRMMQQIAHPSATPVLPFPAQEYGAIFGLAFLALILAPFTNNAVAVGVASIYAGRLPSYAVGFARVLSRWLPLLGTAILSFLILVSVYVGMVFGLVIPVVIGSLILRGSALGFLVVMLLGLLLGIAMLLVFMQIFICCAFALYATTIENKNPGEAIGVAFRRIFNRREFWKALLIGLASIAMQIGAFIVSGAIELAIIYYLHSTALDEAFGTVLNAMLTAFVTIVLAVYYYDVRTRSEGLDLEVDVERLAAVP